MLTPGTKIGAYEIVGSLGAGGMGVVYRAHDPRLGRDVAVKILPELFAADPDRLQRFEREARTLAALNHPHIAGIFGIEEAHRALVMELVEGEDLSQRIARGALPLDDALAIARQIADGLEAAHQQGIVHRDLKPSNLKIRPDGVVKILDLGLAKAFTSEPAAAGGSGSPTVLPTMTSPAMTAMGMIVGTAAYMSPEQARGRAVDRRADLWAFGVVLFEMLTGRQAFAGESVTDVLAAVVKEDPDWSALPADTPRSIRRLLRRCLEKDPKRRLHDAADARLEIDDALAAHVEDAAPADGGGAGTRRSPAWVRALVWSLGLLAAGAAGAAAAWMLQATPDLPVRRFSIHTPGGARATEAIIAPDGRHILFTAAGKLWIQPLDRLNAREVPGATNARALMWAPDGREIGFQSNGFLWRSDLAGSTPVRLGAVPADFSGAGGAAWLPDGRIWFTTGGTSLLELASDGKGPRTLVPLDESKEVDIHHVGLLPGGRGVLFVPHHLDKPSIDVFDGRERRMVFPTPGLTRQPVYSPSGHLLFVRDGGVWALKFSLSTMSTSGEPFLVATDAASPSVSEDGTLVVIPEGSSSDTQLTWVEPGSRVMGTLGRSGMPIRYPKVSPDGRSVVATVSGGNPDLYIFDVGRGTDRRLTFENGSDTAAVWSPDGRHIVYQCGDAICARRADGTGSRVEMVPAPAGAPTVSSDGKYLAFVREQARTANDLFVVPIGPGGFDAPPVEAPRPIVVAERLQNSVDISPDGTLAAYDSNETGVSEVYITTFPAGQGKWQVSRNGGIRPLWSRTGDRIFYANSDGLVEVPIERNPTPTSGTPREILSGPLLGTRVNALGVDRSIDGTRFLVVRPTSGLTEAGSLQLVEQWFKEHRDR